MFYASVLPLLAYYALFASVLYPIAGSLHPLDLMHSLMPAVPVGLHGLLKVAGHWWVLNGRGTSCSTRCC